MKPEDIRETLVPITVNRLWGQDMDISDQDLTMTIERFGDRYVEPAVAIIAQMVDGEGLDLSRNIYNYTGTPGTLPSSLSTYTDADSVLADNACPQINSMKSLVVNPRMMANVLGFTSNLFSPAKTISEQYRTGRMGEAVGFKWSMDQNVTRQTVGLVGTSTPLVNGANQSGNAIITDGWDHSVQVLNRGDIVTFAVNAVNPLSYRDSGQLRSFVVTNDVTSDSGGNATIPISPDINADANSPFQTVTGLPADNAVIRVYGVLAANFANISGVSSAQGLAFHKDAFTLVIVRLEKPGGMEWSEEVSNPKIGLSCRLVRGYDIRANRKLTRVDVLGGWKTLRPEFACRVASN